MIKGKYNEKDDSYRAKQIRSARSQPHESLEHAPRIAACLPGAPYFSFDDAGGSLPAHPTRSGFRREIQTSRETLSRRGSGWQTILQCTGFHQSERHAGE